MMRFIRLYRHQGLFVEGPAEIKYITISETITTVGDERVPFDCMFFTNFLQERLQDLAKSETFFLSILPPDIDSFNCRKTSGWEYLLL